MTDKTVDYAITADPSGYVDGWGKVVEATKEGSAQIAESFNQIGELFTGLQEKFAALAAMLAGGEMFKDGIQSVRNQTDEAVILGNQLGITSQKAAVFADGLKNAFVETDKYVGVTQAVTKALNRNEAAFHAAGVVTRDAADQMLPIQDIISNLVGALDKFKAGTDRNMMAQQIATRGYQDLIDVMRVTPEALDRARESFEAYHTVIDPEKVMAYKTAMKELHDAVENFEQAIGNAAMPVLTELGNWMAQAGPTAAAAMGVAMNTVVDVFNGVKGAAMTLWGGLSQALGLIADLVQDVFGVQIPKFSQIVINMFKVIEMTVLSMEAVLELAFEGIRGAVITLETALVHFAIVAWKAFTMDFAGAKVAWEQGNRALEAVVAESAERIVKVREKLAARLNAIALGSPTDPKEQHVGGGNKQAYKLPKNGPEKSQMPDFEAELAQLKLKYQQENNFREMDKAQEAAFWQAKLAIVDINSKDFSQILRKMYTDQFEYAKKQHEKDLALQKEQIDSWETNASKHIDIAEAEGKRLAENGTISKQTQLQQELAFEQQRLEIQRKAQEQRIALLAKGPDNPAALQAAKDKLVTIEQNYAQRVVKINQDMDKETLQFWQNTLQPMAQMFNNMLVNMGTRTQTWGQQLNQVWRSLVNSAWGWVVRTMEAEWAKTEAAKTIQTQIQSAARAVLETLGLAKTTAAQQTAAATNIATDKASAASQVATAVGLAGANGVASFAMAPWPVDMGAPAFGAAMAATAASLGSVAGLAVGSWEVPGDMFTKIHKGETVIPAQFAERFRDGDGGGGGKGGSALHIHATDARSVERMFRSNGDALSKAMKTARRMGNKNLRKR